MARKSKRELERELADLETADGGDHEPMIINLTSVVGESPHPDLTVQPWPEKRPRSRRIATPNLLPDEYLTERVLSVHNCENVDKHRADPDGDGAVYGCELWDALSDDARGEEYRTRKANDEPIPNLLEDYAPKE